MERKPKAVVVFDGDGYHKEFLNVIKKQNCKSIHISSGMNPNVGINENISYDYNFVLNYDSSTGTDNEYLENISSLYTISSVICGYNMFTPRDIFEQLCKYFDKPFNDRKIYEKIEDNDSLRKFCISNNINHISEIKAEDRVNDFLGYKIIMWNRETILGPENKIIHAWKVNYTGNFTVSSITLASNEEIDKMKKYLVKINDLIGVKVGNFTLNIVTFNNKLYLHSCSVRNPDVLVDKIFYQVFRKSQLKDLIQRNSGQHMLEMKAVTNVYLRFLIPKKEGFIYPDRKSISDLSSLKKYYFNNELYVKSGSVCGYVILENSLKFTLNSDIKILNSWLSLKFDREIIPKEPFKDKCINFVWKHREPILGYSILFCGLYLGYKGAGLSTSAQKNKFTF